MLPLAIALLQTGLARPITFDEPAMPLARLLPSLGQKAGVELTAGANVARDVVLVHVKEKPLGEVLRRLAAEDGAEIEATKTGYRVVRTPSSERAEHRAALAKRLASLQKAFDATRTSLALPVDAATASAVAAEVQRHPAAAGGVTAGATTALARTPGVRCAMRVALALPAETVADLQEGDRIVYSNRPTRLQLPLPGADALLRSFAQDQSAWASAAGRLGVAPGPYLSDPFRNVEPLGAPPARIVATLWRTNSAASAIVRVLLLDAQGEMLGSGDYSLQTDRMQAAMSSFTATTKSEPVALSPETKAFLNGLGPLRGAPLGFRPSPEAIELLRHPEEHDPLSFGATDLLRDWAGDRPMVAVLPDRCWVVGMISPEGLQRKDMAFVDADAERREEGGWLLVRPREPEITRSSRVSRAVLGRFVRAIESERRVPLDAYAEYAWNASDARSDILGVLIAMKLAGGVFNPDVDWRVLRLYGSLSVTDRKVMLDGGAKTWATLSPKQRDLAVWIVNHQISSSRGAAGGPLALEPTEKFADGYEGLEITLASHEDRPLFCDSTTNAAARNWRRVLEPSSVGNALAQDDGPGFNRFGIARRTTYNLTIRARRDTSTGASLEDVSLPDGVLMPLEKLPDDVRAQIEQAKTEAERRKAPQSAPSSP